MRHDTPLRLALALLAFALLGVALLCGTFGDVFTASVACFGAAFFGTFTLVLGIE